MGSRSPAGPRRLVTATRIMRIAVTQALCALREHTRPRPKSGKVCRSDTRPGDVCERAERSEGSDTTPIRNAPCEPLCAILLAKASVYPPQPLETNVAAFVGDVRKGPVNPAPRWETEPFGMGASLPAMPCFGGFRPLFARSIKAQDKGPVSYTHLDVYKRQTYLCGRIRIRRNDK